MKKKNIYLLGLALLFAAPQTMAQDVAAHFDMRYKLGNKRQITSPELFLPLQQDTNSLLFADIRAMFDGNNNKEGNLGLGYRQLEDDYIWGVYGFLDRRKSRFDVYHGQATLGAEWLTEDWDFRVNGYVPLTDKKILSGFGGGATSIQLQGNSVVQSGGGGAFEKTMGGMDAEVGYQFLPGFRAFAGGYTFRADEVPDINGYRGRLQYDVNDYLRLGLEYQRDQVRGENRYAEIRVRIPFGANAKNDVKGLRKRLAEPVVRDIDIVTSVRETEGGGAAGNVINPDTGQAQEIWYVDNSNATPVVAGGAGSFEDPFLTLQDAITAAGPGDIIYVYRGLATTAGMDTGYTLNHSGMQLIGSGIDLVYNGSRVTAGGSGQVLIGNAGNALIANNVSGPVLQVNNQNIVIAGVQLSGANNAAIRTIGSNASGLVIDTVITDNTNQNGIFLGTSSASSNITVRNVDLASNAIYGLMAENINNLTIENTSVLGSGPNDGIILRYNQAGTYGITLDDLYLEHNNIGVTMTAENAAVVNLSANDITTFNNARGMQLAADTAAALTTDITNSALADNTYAGLFIDSRDNMTTFEVNVDNVDFSNNNNVGIRGREQFTLNVDNSTITTLNDGIYVQNNFGLSTVNLGAGVLVTGNVRGYINEYASALGLAGGLYPGGVFGNTLNEADGAGNNVTGNNASGPTQDIEITPF